MGVRRWLRELTASKETLEVLRAVEALPATAIADLPDEIVGRIAGTVREIDGAHLMSPLGQVRCVWWRLEISGGPYLNVRHGGIEFELADVTGRARIDPTHVRSLVTATHFSRCRGIRGASAGQRPFLAELGVVDPTPSLFVVTGQQTQPDRFRFAEAVVVAGAPLVVVGAGQREADPDAPGRGFRSIGTRIRIAGSPVRPIYLTDEL